MGRWGGGEQGKRLKVKGKRNQFNLYPLPRLVSLPVLSFVVGVGVGVGVGEASRREASRREASRREGSNHTPFPFPLSPFPFPLSPCP
ncbi:hypothetical protein, partial [Nostoc linckia]